MVIALSFRFNSDFFVQSNLDIKIFIDMELYEFASWPWGPVTANGVNLLTGMYGAYIIICGRDQR